MTREKPYHQPANTEVAIHAELKKLKISNIAADTIA